jgi:hypothetical protein
MRLRIIRRITVSAEVPSLPYRGPWVRDLRGSDERCFFWSALRLAAAQQAGVLRFLIHFQHMETGFFLECAEGAKAGHYKDWHGFAVESANVLDLHSALGRPLAINGSKPPAPVGRITPFDIERRIDTEQHIDRSVGSKVSHALSKIIELQSSPARQLARGAGRMFARRVVPLEQAFGRPRSLADAIGQF